MNFVKMHGAGNDYIFVDCFEKKIEDMERLSIQMSDRHFGVGGDGVVYLYPSDVSDVKMRMFNADGSEGAMCGNALRCIAKLMCDKLCKNDISVETNSGIKSVSYLGNGLFTVDMGAPIFGNVNQPISVSGVQLSYSYVSMGNPHCVIFSDDVDCMDMSIGREIEKHFPGGINVEFVQCVENGLKVRVHERGSGETLSCGTGACAAVAVSALTGKCSKNSDINVFLRGGCLRINYNKTIFLTGNAVKVYEGDYNDKVYFCDRWSCKRTR